MFPTVVYQRKQAFVIGIDKYLSDPLTCCINDASDFKKALESIGFTVQLEKNCNLKAFTQALDDFTIGIEQTDLILFYFAGHAKLYKSDNYLLLSDSDYATDKSESYYMKENAMTIRRILKHLIHKNCSAVIAIFDCCRKSSGSVGASTRPDALSIKGSAHAIVVYSNFMGEGTLGETENGRNGYVMENLLKYITAPYIDIKTLLKRVGSDLYTQTKKSRILFHDSELKEKVFLAYTHGQGENDWFLQQ